MTRQWEGELAENPRKKLIYVKEYDTQGHEKEGWISEDKYAKLYYPQSLEMLKKEGVHGDAIGQGVAMWSATFDKLMQRYDNTLSDINREIEIDIRRYGHCVKTRGKSECKTQKIELEQSKKARKDLRQNHIRLLKIKIEDD